LFNRGYNVDLARVNAAEGRAENQYELCKTITDLPPYQWQYPKEITLFENRWTREWRLRMHPRHDILGSRIPGANKNEPTWRNLLCVNNVPWLKDHRVSARPILSGSRLTFDVARKRHRFSLHRLPLLGTGGSNSSC